MKTLDASSSNPASAFTQAAVSKLTWLVIGVFALMGGTQLTFGEANYVYHERSGNNVGCNSIPFVDNLTPTSAQSVQVGYKVEYAGYWNQARVYYTTNGSTPIGSKGNGSNTTAVVSATFQCGWNCGGPANCETLRGTIPAQAAGTTVKYIVSAWHSGGGDEIFANGCGNCGSETSASGTATNFSYQVACATKNFSVQPANQTVCSGSTSGFSVTASGTGLGYQWQWSTNGGGNFFNVTNGTGGTTSSYTTATTTTNYSGYQYRCVITDTCSSSSNSTAATLTVNAPPATPGAITGSTCVDSNQVGVTYFIAEVSGATGYLWTVPSGASITAGQGTTNITVTFGTSSGSVTVVGTNSNCSGATNTLTVGLNGVEAAGSITGSSSVCAGQSGVAYSISSVTGAAGYDWSVPSGASITAGQGTASITVTFGTTSGNVSVTPTNGACSGTSSSLGITVTSVSAAGAITGYDNVAAGSNNVSYLITEVANATGYTWTVPSGATITGGQGTTNLTVDFGCSAVSGNVTVTPTNGPCSGTSASLAVTVVSVGAAGAITGASSVGAGATNISYSISAVSGATTYSWTVPAGATVASGQGTTAITVDFACGASSGNVEVTPANEHGCTGTAGTKAVTVVAVGAAGAISGLTNVCTPQTTSYTISAVSGASAYTWTVPANASIDSGQGTTSISVTFSNSSASGNVQVTPSNTNGCTGTASTLAVTASTAPSISTQATNYTACSGSTAAFSIVADGSPLNYAWRKQGSGWGANGAWVFSGAGTIAEGGLFVGSAANNGGNGSINTSSKSWGMYANNGKVVAAVRKFSAMPVGQQFRISVANGFIDTGSTVGFGLRNSESNNLFEIYFKGGTNFYKINDSTGERNTTVGFTRDGISVVFVLTTTSNYSVTITPSGGSAYTTTGLLKNPTGGQSITQVRLFNANAGTGSDHDAYFNSITVPGGYDDSAASYSTQSGNTGWLYSGGNNGGQGPLSNGGGISGADTATLTLSGVTTNDNGAQYSCQLNNSCGVATSSTVTLTVNQSPTAANDSYNRTANLSVKIAKTNLLANDSAGAGLVSFSSPTTNGITLSEDATYIYYPSNATNLNDIFTYVVTNASGCSATATVNINLAQSSSVQSISFTNGGGSVTANFAGIPTYPYAIERATNVLFTLGTNTWFTNAPAGGLFQFVDNFTDLGATPNEAYYRLRYNP